MGRWCERCRRRVSPDDEFCPECGTRVVEEMASTPAPEVCPCCEARVPEGATICPSCGIYPARVFMRTCPRCRTPWKYGRPPTRSRDILAVAMVGGLGAAVSQWLGPTWGLKGSFIMVVAPVLVVLVLALSVNWTSPRIHYCTGCGRRRMSRDITLTVAMGILAVIIVVFVVSILIRT